MEAVLLVIHLLACLALIGAVLLQRSEGGALGMSGGGTGSFISGRGVANVLVRTTMILGASFFITSLVLARIHSEKAKRETTLERTIEDRSNDAFDPLSSGGAAAPGAPSTATPTPAAPAPTDPLAPVVNQPSTGAASPPAASTTTTPPPAAASAPAPKPAPATPAPAPATTTPAPTPAPAAPQ